MATGEEEQTREVSESVIRQCKRDAEAADRTDEALDAADSANSRADRAEGALDYCERKRQDAQTRETRATVVAVAGWVAAAVLGGWLVAEKVGE